MRTIVCGAVLLAATALAIPKGGTVYVVPGGATLYKRADEKSPAVAKLKGGDELIWEGPDDNNRSFHKMRHGGKSGFVKFEHFTMAKPQVEVHSANLDNAIRLGLLLPDGGAGETAFIIHNDRWYLDGGSPDAGPRDGGKR